MRPLTRQRHHRLKERSTTMPLNTTVGLHHITHISATGVTLQERT